MGYCAERNRQIKQCFDASEWTQSLIHILRDLNCQSAIQIHWLYRCVKQYRLILSSIFLLVYPSDYVHMAIRKVI